MKSPVLAFLQNMWFPVGTPGSIIASYLSDQSFRRRVLGNCMTGRRLKRAFGEKYHEIWWENASQGCSVEAKGRCEADMDHMWRCIYDVQPLGIVTFGGVARDALLKMFHRNSLVPIFKSSDPTYDKENLDKAWHYFPHPNARGLTQAQLDEFAKKIIELYF